MSEKRTDRDRSLTSLLSHMLREFALKNVIEEKKADANFFIK